MVPITNEVVRGTLGEDLIPFALGVLGRSMIGKQSQNPPSPSAPS